MLRLLLRSFQLLLVLVLLSAALLGWYASKPLPLQHVPLDFEITRGESLSQVARNLKAAGVDLAPGVLVWLGRLSGQASRVKAGSYRIDTPMSAWNLLQLISRGANAYAEISFIEGWSFARVRAALNAHPALAHDSMALSDSELMRALGFQGEQPEGWFAPDTYSFSRGSSDLEVLKRARHRMDELLRSEWKGRAAGLPLNTPYEALILASVIEKETGRASDRALIASVFINRLRIGMPLQSDPTVIYGLGSQFDGNLRKRDLQRDTAFNSYTRGGLPPTPISMPGQAALQATLHPAASNYLYFVAKGDGHSEFSRSLEEHNRAVTRFQKAGRGK